MVNRIMQFLEKDKETTMRLEFAFLCDYIDVTGKGLFNSYGTGIHAFHCRRLPDSRPVMLVMSIEYDPVEDCGSHTIAIRIIDPDGQNRINPIVINAEFESTLRFHCFDTKLYPTFDKYGLHSVEIILDGNIIASISLDLIRDDK